MLIKIAIFTIIGLSVSVLYRLLGPGVWQMFRRVSLERKLTKINNLREHLLRLQRILELPDAYEQLLAEGIVAYRGQGRFDFNESPETWPVRLFIKANSADAANNEDSYRLSWMLEILQRQEDRIQADLYFITVHDKPAHRDRQLIEQRSKIAQMEHQLAAERKKLERLEAQDRSPDPYGRVPKMRLERYVPIDATETKKAPHSRKKRA